MLPRLPVALGLAFLAVLSALSLSGCSSSHRRDQYFGTNAGADYEVPDAAVFSGQTDADASADDAEDDTGLQAVPPDTSVQESGPATDS